MEIVGGKIVEWEDDGRVVIEAGLPSIDRAVLRRYDHVLVGLPDGRKISPEQRKKAHALIGEIAEWTGELPESMKRLMKLDFIAERLQTLGNKMFSLRDVDVTTAKEFITFLIDFMLEHGVPSRIPLYEQCEDIGRYVYACAMNKRCAVCGRKADIHHLHGSRVGHGGLRWREKDQAGAVIIPLCRVHHTECHTDEEGFLARYHLQGISMTREIAKQYKANYKE